MNRNKVLLKNYSYQEVNIIWPFNASLPYDVLFCIKSEFRKAMLLALKTNVICSNWNDYV